MQFSRFSEFGLLGQFSGGKPLAESIYDSLWANLNGNGAVQNYSGKGTGGYTDTKLYATAMGTARLVATLRRIRAQIEPDTVLEMLPARERQFGVVVPYGATLTQRRTTLKAAMRAPGHGTYGDMWQALTDALGPAFVDLRRLPAASLVNVPANPVAGPGLFIKPNGRRRLFKLVAPLTAGVPGVVTFVYVHLDGSTVTPDQQLQAGERFVLEAGHNVLQERVTASGVATTVGGQAATSGYVRHAHQAGAVLTTAPFPYWLSNRCHWVVQLTPAAALAPDARRRTHRLMRRIERGTETCVIAGSTGPFILGASPLGITPFDAAST